MGTALVVPREERRLGIMDVRKVDITKAKASLAARGSSTRLFPGEALNFKKGRWYFGFNKTKRSRVKTGTQFVMNLANTVETWQTFVDGKPRFAPLAYIINGESRAPREEMGQTDEDAWDVGDDGNPMDPVQAITVCPIREKGSTELQHISLSSISARIAFDKLLADWLDQYEAQPGKLPVVELLEAEERTRKGSKQTFLAPVFEIVGWEKASAVDNPGPGGIEVASGGGGDGDGEDEDAPKSRKGAAKPSKAREPEPEEDQEEAPRSRKATGKPAKARQPEPDEPEEEEDEDDETDLRGKRVDHSRGNGKAVKSRDPEPEEEEDEDDKPRAVSRSSSVKAKAKQPEPEEEEEEVPVRRKRRALH